MNTILEEHQKITLEAKNKIASIPIVFPATYGKIYYDMARSRNIELSPEELFTSEMVDEKIVRHIITLSTCAEQAVEAIENEDKKALQAVLAETKALRDEIQELRKFVYEDSLTKSYNRKWFDDTFMEKDHLSLRESGAIVIIDLNDFKGINDTYGHVIGDKVLVHVARKLKESGGRVVRYGGDEFLVIFDISVTESQIQEKIETILHYFEKVHFKVENKNFKISFAYGLASFHPGSTLNEVIDTADKAMYRHKKMI